MCHLPEAKPAPVRLIAVGTRLQDACGGNSSRKPGAALSLDPCVGTARFVVDGLDLDTNVTQIAAQIANDIAERARTGKPPDTWTHIFRTERKRTFPEIMCS